MSSKETIYLAIKRQAEDNAKVAEELDKKAKEVQEFARSIAPVDSGEYAAGIKVKKGKSAGFPSRVVAFTDPKSEEIEFGTGPAAKHNQRKQGGSSPEFAISAKTKAQFDL